MKNKRAWLLSGLCAGALMMPALSASAAVDVNTSVSDDRLTVTVYGKAEGGRANEAAVLYVENQDGEAVHIQQGVCGTDGEISFTYIFNQDNEGGDYRHIVVTQYGHREEKTVHIADLSALNRLLDTVNGASSAGEIIAAMKENAENYGLEYAIFDKIDKSFLCRKLYSYVKKQKPFESVEELKTQMEALTVLSALNQGFSEMLENGRLTAYSALGIDEELYKKYDTQISDSGRANVNGNMFGKNFESLERAAEAFEKLVYTNMITNYINAGIGHAEGFLLNYGSVIGVDISKYNALSADKRESVLRTLCNSKAASPDQFITVYNSAVSSANQPISSYPSSGGGGGSARPGSNALPGGFNASQSAENTANTDTSVNEFTDLEGFEWAHEAISALKNKGIIRGKSENRFAANDNVTREEFVAMIVRAFDFGEAAQTAPSFDDVDSGAWYYDDIALAAGLGIVNGTENNRFGIGQPITREDIAAILYRALSALTNVESNSGAENFTDSDKISDYAVKGIGLCRENGIINGYPDGSFRPQQPATRAEAAKILYGAMNYTGVTK